MGAAQVEEAKAAVKRRRKRLPSQLRLVSAFGFVDEATGEVLHWREGEVEMNPERIRRLLARHAPVREVDDE